MQKLEYESRASRDHRKLRQIVRIIQAAGIEGVKKGNLIIDSQVPFAQWQFYHPVLMAVDGVIYDKPLQRYCWIK